MGHFSFGRAGWNSHPLHSRMILILTWGRTRCRRSCKPSIGPRTQNVTKFYIFFS